MRHAVYAEGNGRAVTAAVIRDAIEAAQFPKAQPPLRISVSAPPLAKWKQHGDHLRRGWTAYGECPVCIERGRVAPESESEKRMRWGDR